MERAIAELLRFVIFFSLLILGCGFIAVHSIPYVQETKVWLSIILVGVFTASIIVVSFMAYTDYNKFVAIKDKTPELRNRQTYMTYLLALVIALYLSWINY
jgi:hypothetical protein